MKAFMLSAATACIALGSPALAQADTASAAGHAAALPATTTLVCRAPSAAEQQNAMLGTVALVCTTQKNAVAMARPAQQQGLVLQRDDQSWVYDIFMLDHDRGGDGG